MILIFDQKPKNPQQTLINYENFPTILKISEINMHVKQFDLKQWICTQVN